VSGQTTVDLPANAAQEPVYTIPPDTTSLTVTANSTPPAQLELQSSGLEFDLFGNLANAQAGNSISTANVTAPGSGSFITRGLWNTSLAEIGPFTNAGETSGQSTITSSMVTQGFDSTV